MNIDTATGKNKDLDNLDYFGIFAVLCNTHVPSDQHVELRFWGGFLFRTTAPPGIKSVAGHFDTGTMSVYSEKIGLSLSRLYGVPFT